MHANDALLTASLAVGLGIFAQLLAHRFRLPALVLLLLFGALSGPDGLGLLHPASLGEGLSLLVKLAVAIVLFEGALALRLEDLRRSLFEVRRLVTLGAAVTWLGASLAGYLLGGLSPGAAVVFGALVVVTGPTVVQPLLKRVAVPRRIKAVLEGEAILIDPVGAILAVAVFEAVLGFRQAGGAALPEAALGYLARLGAGGLVGVLAGLGLTWLLKQPRWVGLELKNLTALAGVLLTYGFAEAVLSESGIMAAVALGLVVQRGAIPEEHRLKRFKEQLTLLAISLLFVLLAADLPLATVRSALLPGVSVALFLLLVVRPLAVALALSGSELGLRERVFVAALAPRGIVAASVASLFALFLPGEGERLLALVFLTIFVSVVAASLLAPLLARALGLSSAAGRLLVVVGAGGLGRTVARILAREGRPVVLLDRNPQKVREAERERLFVVRGNALEEDDLEAAGADEAGALLAVTPNPEVNLLAVQLGREVFGIPRAYPALDPGSAGLELVRRVGAELAFGRPVDVEDWDHALAHRGAQVLEYALPEGFAGGPVGELDLPPELLPLLRRRGEGLEVVHAAQTWAPGERIYFASRLAEDETRALLDRLLAPSG